MLVKEDLALEFDAAAGKPDGWVLPGVKLLGRKSLNGREYPPAVQTAAVPLFDGSIVYLDHFDVSDKSRRVTDNRPYSERIGAVTSPRYDAAGECTRGDLVLNPAHPLAPAIRHDFLAGTKRVGMSLVGDVTWDDPVAKTRVKQLTRVYSCDVVNNPGATTTLKEDLETPPDAEPSRDHLLGRLTALEATNAQLVTEVAKLAASKPTSTHVPNPFTAPPPPAQDGRQAPAGPSPLLVRPFG